MQHTKTESLRQIYTSFLEKHVNSIFTSFLTPKSSLPACSESAIASFQIATLQNGILTSDCPNANYTAYDFGKNDYNLKTVAEGPLSSPVEIKTDFVRVRTFRLFLIHLGQLR